MDLDDILVAAKTMPFDKLEPKLNALVREHSKFKNLDEANRQLILDLIKKYLPKIRKGLGLSAMNLREEMHQLWEDRVKLNLKESDLDDIREILELFKR